MTNEPYHYADERQQITKDWESTGPVNRPLIQAWIADQLRRGRRVSAMDAYARDLIILDRFLCGRSILTLAAPEAREFLKQAGEGTLAD